VIFFNNTDSNYVHRHWTNLCAKLEHINKLLVLSQSSLDLKLHRILKQANLMTPAVKLWNILQVVKHSWHYLSSCVCKNHTGVCLPDMLYVHAVVLGGGRKVFLPCTSTDATTQTWITGWLNSFQTGVSHMSRNWKTTVHSFQTLDLLAQHKSL